jgi:hypothetical protein
LSSVASRFLSAHCALRLPPTGCIPRPSLATWSAPPRAGGSGPCCGNHAQAADTVPLCSSQSSPVLKTANALTGLRFDLPRRVQFEQL